MKLLFFLFSITLCLFACSESKKEMSKGAVVSVPKADEDELFTRLMGELVQNPQTNYQKERNELINYAMDNLIDFQETSNGLMYLVVNPGEGPKGKWGKKVKVYYKGYFSDGKVFDQKLRKQGPPFEFFIGNTIHAWNQGLEMIAPGGKILLLSPSHLAYGEEGAGNGLIPPNKPLIFEIEFVSFLKPPKAPTDS